jgi:hypothetical protein
MTNPWKTCMQCMCICKRWASGASSAAAQVSQASQAVAGATHVHKTNVNLLTWGLLPPRRPVYNKADDFVLVVSVDKYSFPSGHASRQDAFAI